jgi:hypothetical protein
MPTVEELAARPHLQRDRPTLAICQLLVRHGINPDEIPQRSDALTERGYLVAVGIDEAQAQILTEERPWPPGLTLEDVRAAWRAA